MALLTVMLAKAELTVTTESDGTVVLTLNATGDLGREIPQDGSNWRLKPSAKIQPVLNATKMRIVTKNGAQMNDADIQALCGIEDPQNVFNNLRELDMSEATVANTNDWGSNYVTRMKWIDTLEKYTFPKTATHIPNSIFSQHAKLKEVIIPDNLDRTYDIGQQAFYGCPSLEKAYIGGKTSKVGSMAFNGCTKLKTLDFGYGSDDMKFEQQAFYGCTSLEEVVLPEGLKEIGYGAFSGSAIRAIRLPNSLETIRGTAFNCEFLESITIPENVKLIEYNAFQNNKNLKDVWVLGTNTAAQEQAFQPMVTYSYTYNGTGTGEEVDPRTAYRPGAGKNVVTVFHYPEAAKDKYVNPVIKTLGTSGNNMRYTTDSYGNKIPVVDDGKFNGDGTAYAGWHDFMVTGKIRPEEIFTNDVRIRDVWYSMCLPFDMTEIQLKSAYGATVEVVEFSKAYVKRVDGTKYLTLEFKSPVKTTKAHHPYMIHPGIHSGNLTGVKNTITGIVRKPETDDALKSESVTLPADGVDYKFIGNYTQGKQQPAPSYFYYNGAGATNGSYPAGFYKRTIAGGTWGKYTALVIPSREDNVQAKTFNPAFFYVDELVFDSEEGQTPTAIKAIAVAGDEQGEDVVRNLNGQVVRTGSSLEGLPKGIYIVNGKKYVVR